MRAGQLRHLATALGAIVVGSVLLMALFAPILAPHDPFAQDLMARLTPPQWMDGGRPRIRSAPTNSAATIFPV